MNTYELYDEIIAKYEQIIVMLREIIEMTKRNDDFTQNRRRICL